MINKTKQGNVLISVALTGGLLLFVAAFINAGLRALHPIDTHGSVQGVFIAQRATLTPEPSPIVQVNIRNQAGALAGVPGATICHGGWGATVGQVTTTNCTTTSAGSLSIIAPEYRSLYPNSGIYVALPTGWSITNVTSDTTTNFINGGLLTAFNNSVKGNVYGWPTSNFITGTRTINVTTASPLPAPANLKATCAADNKTFSLSWSAVGGTATGKYAVVISYYPFTYTETRTTSVATTTSYSSYTYWNLPGFENVKFRAKVTAVSTGEDQYNPAGNPATVDFSCPYLTATPSLTVAPTEPKTTATPPPNCQYVAEVCTNSFPPNCTYKLECTSPKPTCAMDCLLQPKGDATCNLVVDSEDYTYWLLKYTNKPIPAELQSKKGPDFNNDGKVNLYDLQIWQNGLYTPPPTPAGACAVPTTVKPTSALPTPPPSASGTWTQMYTTNAPAPRFNHSAGMLANGKTFVFGGNISSSNPLATDPGYIYDPATNS
jgi:hypothetical protein